jgi:hypothetical protein
MFSPRTFDAGALPDEAPTATMDVGNAAMKLPETQASAHPPPKSGSLKFTYASGDRPLEGYTIKRGVGRGGFGEVYYATSDGGKEVALKLIRRNLEVELRGVSQCLNLKHPYLISLFDIKQDEHGDSWVVMEYVSGECLEEIIARNPNGMPLPEVLSWIHGIGAGVAYLHDRGIVHRDLKPGNIFSDEGLVKIGDYGLSKFISASRRSGQTESVGTVHYMAPEVANGRYGKEIDVYALGIMLYEMLTGHVPFEGESVGEVLMKHLTAEPDLGVLEEPYRTVVARALTKDPEKRFRTVGQMLALLPQPALPHVLVNPQAVKPAPEALLVGEPVRHNGAHASPQVVPAQVIHEDGEPIWRAVRDAWRQLEHGWAHSGIPVPVKVVLVIGVVLVLIKTAGFWMPTAFVALIAYGVYRLVRAVVLANKRPAGGSPFAAHPPAQPPPNGFRTAAVSAPAPVRPAAAPRRPAVRREHPATALLIKTPRERLTELLGSMLLGTLATAVLCIVLELLLPASPTPSQFAWLAIVGSTAGWALMAVSKFWEGTQGEPILRRFVLLLLGLGVGLFAYGLKEHLRVDLPAGMGSGELGWGSYQASMVDASGEPNLKCFLAYFGFLFPALRWWKQTDPLRWTRLSLWSAAVCVFWAWLLNAAWPFPQPWGLMVAATVAISVQLASPWVDLQRRGPGYLR